MKVGSEVPSHSPTKSIISYHSDMQYSSALGQVIIEVIGVRFYEFRLLRTIERRTVARVCRHRQNNLQPTVHADMHSKHENAPLVAKQS